MESRQFTKWKNPSWGNNQQLSANVPLEIKMKSNGTNQLKATKKHVKVSDIPEEIFKTTGKIHM